MKKTFFYITATTAALLLFFSCASLPQNTDVQQNESKTESFHEEEKPESKKQITAINNSVPDGEIELLDGFEDELYWFADGETKSDDFSISAEITEEWSNDGTSSCKMTFSKTPEKFTSSFSCESLLDKNWEGVKLLTADFNNTSGKPVELFLEIQSGNNHCITRTGTVELGAGENTNVYFDLLHELINSDGERVSGIIDDNDVRAISFRIIGKHSGGTVYMDNICIIR